MNLKSDIIYTAYKKVYVTCSSKNYTVRIECEMRYLANQMS